MRTDWDKTTTRRPSRNAEIIYELVMANTRDLAALRTHGCGIRGKAATDSDGRRPSIPTESDHPIRTKAATLLIG
jgi:hypothetical protein